MDRKVLRSNLLLFLAAAIWGFTFVAQRVGMEHVGPFFFNGVRFALGALALIPFLPRGPFPSTAPEKGKDPITIRTACLGSGLAGLTVYAGASLQQIGLVHTTAGKAGFITGLYVILVPIMGLALGRNSGFGIWMGAVLASVGLYLLSVTETFTISPGDLPVLIGAFFWAGHVHLIGWLSGRIHPIRLAFRQFLICSALSLTTALFFEVIVFQNLLRVIVPVLYAGLLSVGVAYTLQVVAQQYAQPGHTAIILSLEAVFAVAGGWLILGEVLTIRGVIGCGLMLAGMIISQVRSRGVPLK